MGGDSCHDRHPAGRAVIHGFRRADVWSGSVLAALGAWIVSEAQRWEYLGPDGPGAGFFPLWYGIAMVVLSAALVARSVLAKGVDKSRGPLAWAEIRRAFGCWCSLVVSVALLKVISNTCSPSSCPGGPSSGARRAGVKNTVWAPPTSGSPARAGTGLLSWSNASTDVTQKR